MLSDGGRLAVGLGAALAGTLLVSWGVVIQASAARDVEAQHGLRLRLIGRLVRRPRWVFGAAIAYLAFPLQLVALAHAPLILVEPVHAAGLLVVLVAGVRVLRERLRTPELIGAGAITAGLAMLAWGAPNGRDPETSHAVFAAITGMLILAAWVPYVLRDRCGRVLLVVCAGVGFAASNVAVKGFSDQLAAGHAFPAAAYLTAAAVASLAAVLSQMTAFQRHPATNVVPITFAIPNFLPVLLALFTLHENWETAALAGGPFILGSLLLIGGTTAVARATPVARVVRQAAG
jgi:drug/metabolite transporter (DMT)-like permease